MTIASADVAKLGFYAGPTVEGSWVCTLCEVTVWSDYHFLTHMNGKNHSKRVNMGGWQRQNSRIATSSADSKANESDVHPETSQGELEDFDQQCAHQFFSSTGTLIATSVIDPLRDDPQPFESAPAHNDDNITCVLCESSLPSWQSWKNHFQSDIHKSRVRAGRWTHAQIWQRLTAGEFQYYYECLTGVWTLECPVGSFPRGGVLAIPLKAKNGGDASDFFPEDS
ncbi:hypothetical protein FOL46_007864 [Perkinsus olseni]|uniref:U1-type domain-containing protein n=1 Tax=Perkinsus olseni TaxID=32597 RepID=A0A7J6LAU2_PEROL|nr:hypothetical protein FOL46_007864 [Perkinsus olseni]